MNQIHLLEITIPNLYRKGDITFGGCSVYFLHTFGIVSVYFCLYFGIVSVIVRITEIIPNYKGVSNCETINSENA